MASILVSGAAFAYTAPLQEYDEPQALVPLRVLEPGGIARHIDGVEPPLTIVHVWATWCAPCVAELPMVNWLARNFKNQGLEVAAISFDGQKNAQKVRDFYAAHSINALPLLFDDEKAVSQALQIRSLPTTLFVANGDVLARVDGVADWQSAEIKQLVMTKLSQFSQLPVLKEDTETATSDDRRATQ